MAAGQYYADRPRPGVVGPYTVNMEAPQSFTATLPLAVTANTLNGTATTGAGCSRTARRRTCTPSPSRPAASSSRSSLRSCPASDNYSPGTWKLLDAATQTMVHSGYERVLLRGLRDAASQLLHAARRGQRHAGPYTLDLLSPQSFTATLPLTTTANTVNGTTTPGASDFETGASQDTYTFTVPPTVSSWTWT